MNCSKCGSKLVFVGSDNNNGLKGHWVCFPCNNNFEEIKKSYDEKEEKALKEFLEESPIDSMPLEVQKAIKTSFKYGFLFGHTSK